MLKLTRGGMEIGIIVRDLEACMAFYREFLGMDLESELELPEARMFRFRLGKNVLKLIVPKDLPSAANPRGAFAATGIRYWTLLVDNLEEVYEKCREAGHAIPISPRDGPYPGARWFVVEDPDGNCLELAQLSPSTVEALGG